MRNFPLHFLIGTGLALGLAIGACSSDDDSGTTITDACSMVIEACHAKDDGTDDVINGCHSRAHDGDDAQCSADLDTCIAACDAAPPIGGDTDPHGSGGHETGHDDHGSGDHGSTGHAGDSTGDHGESSGSTGAASSSGGDDASDASCEELGSICHDTADRFGSMCHDVGHDGDEAACAKVWVECIAHCEA